MSKTRSRASSDRRISRRRSGSASGLMSALKYRASNSPHSSPLTEIPPMGLRCRSNSPCLRGTRNNSTAPPGCFRTGDSPRRSQAKPIFALPSPEARRTPSSKLPLTTEPRGRLRRLLSSSNVVRRRVTSSEVPLKSASTGCRGVSRSSTWASNSAAPSITPVSLPSSMESSGKGSSAASTSRRPRAEPLTRATVPDSPAERREPLTSAPSQRGKMLALPVPK